MNEIKLKSYIITILVAIGLITVSFLIGNISGNGRLEDLETDLNKTRELIVSERNRNSWFTRESYEARKELYNSQRTITLLENSIKSIESQNRENVNSINSIRERNGQDIKSVRSVIKGLDKYLQETEVKN